MQLQLTGRHVEITDAIRQFVDTKFSKLERHFDHITAVHVILSVDSHKQQAEATLQLAGNDIFAKSDDDNMYAAIDALIDKLDRQLIKHKEKLKNHSGSRHHFDESDEDDDLETGADS